MVKNQSHNSKRFAKNPSSIKLFARRIFSQGKSNMGIVIEDIGKLS